MMKKFDLHIHTTFSDGDLSAYAIIDKAKRNGFDTIAITDHETLQQFDIYNKYAKAIGLKLIPGIENNVDGFVGFHFLGYGIQDIEKYMSFLTNIKIQNQNCCFETLELLREHFKIEIDGYDLIKRYSKDGLLDKKIIAKELIALGYAKHTKEVYDVYIGRDAPAYSPLKKITAPQIIKLIHSCGGVAVWAHPQLTKEKISDGKEIQFSEQKIFEVAGWLKENGLDGIEAFNHATTEESSQIINIANELGLIITGGSDFHTMTDGSEIGCPQLVEKDVQILEDKIKSQNLIITEEHCYE